MSVSIAVCTAGMTVRRFMVKFVSSLLKITFLEVQMRKQFDVLSVEAFQKVVNFMPECQLASGRQVPLTIKVICS